MDSLSQKFGSNGSLDATFEATITQEGIEQASMFVAAKSLVGKVQFDSSTKVTFKNEHLDKVTAKIKEIAPSAPTLPLAGDNLRERWQGQREDAFCRS